MKFPKYLLIIILLSLIGCTARYVHIPKLNIIGPGFNGDSVKISNYSLVNKEIESKDYFHIIIFYPIIQDNQDLYSGMIANAVNKICMEKNLEFMTNVRVYYSGWYIPYVYGRFTITIKGEGWSKEKRNAILEDLNNQGVIASFIQDSESEKEI